MQDIFQKIEDRSLELEKGVKSESQEQKCGLKRGSCGRYIPVPPSNVSAPSPCAGLGWVGALQKFSCKRLAITCRL